jgi:fused signal recognition particle receptor
MGKMAGILGRSQFDDALWEELEEILIGADVGINTSAKLIKGVKARVREHEIKGAGIRAALAEEMVSILKISPSETFASLNGKPEVILVVGVNGTGKTTSIAKLAYRLKEQGKQIILAAGDTFRAAAIDQLKYWGERIGVDVIAHHPEGDPGAVVFDALEASKKRGADFLIVDTAGRMQTKHNLMEELKKIRMVISRAGIEPQVLLVLDATTGQNGLSQARYFTEAVAVNGIFLAKLDSTAKGGIVLAIADELRIPISFVGTGQGLDDLAPFKAEEFVEALVS